MYYVRDGIWMRIYQNRHRTYLKITYGQHIRSSRSRSIDP